MSKGALIFEGWRVTSFCPICMFESGLLEQRTPVHPIASHPAGGERSLLLFLLSPSTLVLVHFVYQLAE